MRRAPLLLLLIAAHADAEPAAPAPADEARADELFNQAVELRRSGRAAEACALFEGSLRLAPAALGTQISVARCRVASGQLVAALAMYRALLTQAEAAARDATDEVTAKKQAERVALARTELAAIERSIPRLQIETGGVAARVLIDDAPVDAAVPVPVDAGRHRVAAIDTAGRRAALEVTARADAVVVARLRFLAPPSADRPRSRRALVWSFAGASAAALVTGLVYGDRALQQRDDAYDGQCQPGGTGCDATGLALLDRAGSNAQISTIAVSASLVLGAAAVVLHVTAPRRPGGSAVLQPVIAPTGAGIALGGRW